MVHDGVCETSIQRQRQARDSHTHTRRTFSQCRVAAIHEQISHLVSAAVVVVLLHLVHERTDVLHSIWYRLISDIVVRQVDQLVLQVPQAANQHRDKSRKK